MTTKPQAPKVAEVEQDLPDTTAEAIASEVATRVAAAMEKERQKLHDDLQEAYWITRIEEDETNNEMNKAVIPNIDCMPQARGDEVPESKPSPKPPTDDELRAQRIKAERARLLTHKSKREGA
jgi:hypothetical protein